MGSILRLPRFSYDGPVWFERLGSFTGFDFTHSSGSRGQFYQPEIETCGVGLLNYDRDGRLDLMVVNCVRWSPCRIVCTRAGDRPRARGGRSGQRRIPRRGRDQSRRTRAALAEPDRRTKPLARTATGGCHRRRRSQCGNSYRVQREATLEVPATESGLLFQSGSAGSLRPGRLRRSPARLGPMARWASGRLRTPKSRPITRSEGRPGSAGARILRLVGPLSSSAAPHGQNVNGRSYSNAYPGSKAGWEWIPVGWLTTLESLSTL